ncbi:MAG: peptidoglycan-binding protein [Eubacteriales bacterium]|nr:peptidoglycan-binding protein [Eubacteriales bacterium]
MDRKGARILSALVAAVLVLSICLSALAYETIPFGTESTQVQALQRALKSKGYYKGTVDGTFGQKTRSAVYRYQKAIGITADGRAGNKTLTALYDGLSAANEIDGKKAAAVITKNPDTLYYGCTGSKVKSLQRMLKKAGYFKGSIDGKFGDLTIIAVKRFQWAHGLHGDGLAGKTTITTLKNSITD